MRLSPRAAALQPSPTFAMAARVRQLRAAGRDVIDLSIGEPALPTPAAAVEGARARLLQERFGYPPVAGMQALRQAIVDRYRALYAVDIDPASICVSNGAKQALYNALGSLLGPGDELLLPTPAWVGYHPQVSLFGATTVAVETDPGAGFRLTLEALERARSPQTRALLLNSPSNPTGTTLGASEVAAIARWTADHGIALVSDEIYELVRFDGLSPVSALAYDRGHVIAISGMSKAYAMTGWRVGWSIAPPEVAASISRFQGAISSGISVVSQAAATAALQGAVHPEEMIVALRERRDVLLSALARVPGFSLPAIPRGAFYLFPSVAGLIGRRTPSGVELVDSVAVCQWMLEEHGVAMVPGSAFGAEGHVRLSYGGEKAALAVAGERLAVACAGVLG